MTNEQMFKACNGRTAHRAAKFGLGLGGKLARLEAQEKLAKERRAAENLKKKEESSKIKAQAVIKIESKWEVQVFKHQTEPISPGFIAIPEVNHIFPDKFPTLIIYF